MITAVLWIIFSTSNYSWTPPQLFGKHGGSRFASNFVFRKFSFTANGMPYDHVILEMSNVPCGISREDGET